MTTKALNDLPLEKLIGGPLQAAAKAHAELSNTNLEILKNLAAEKNQEFTFTTTDSNDRNGSLSVSVPTLAMMDLPFFAIDSLTNEFTFEVSSIQDSETTKTGSLTGSASAGGVLSKFVDFKLEAGYNKSQRSSTTNSERGKLNITVTASKAGYSRGMQTILDAAVKAISVKED